MAASIWPAPAPARAAKSQSDNAMSAILKSHPLAHPPARPTDQPDTSSAMAPAQATAAALDTVFIRDLEVGASIGVHTHERADSQMVRINVEMSVDSNTIEIEDNLVNVVCYEDVVVGIKSIIAHGHINLVETLAEHIAGLCLTDRRVARVLVRVEKLHVIAEAASVGVEIERWQKQL